MSLVIIYCILAEYKYEFLSIIITDLKCLNGIVHIHQLQQINFSLMKTLCMSPLQVLLWEVSSGTSRCSSSSWSETFPCQTTPPGCCSPPPSTWKRSVFSPQLPFSSNPGQTAVLLKSKSWLSVMLLWAFFLFHPLWSLSSGLQHH